MQCFTLDIEKKLFDGEFYLYFLYILLAASPAVNANRCILFGLHLKLHDIVAK